MTSHSVDRRRRPSSRPPERKQARLWPERRIRSPIRNVGTFSAQRFSRGPDRPRSRTLPRVHRRRSFPRTRPSRKAPSRRTLRRPHVSPADAAPSPPSTAGASQKWSPRRSKGSGQGSRTARVAPAQQPLDIPRKDANEPRRGRCGQSRTAETSPKRSRHCEADGDGKTSHGPRRRARPSRDPSAPPANGP